MLSVFGILPQDLVNELSAVYPPYRARQLLHWLYARGEIQLSQMTDLPADFKAHLETHYDLCLPAVKQEKESLDGSRKFRLELADGTQIEAVLMPEARKQTLCLSSQVGCARGCGFCATGRMNLIRNLNAAEIVQQVILARQRLQTPLTNIVFMGMGEPLDNLDSVLQAIRIIQHQSGLAFSPRRITLSTCGIVPGIHLLANSGIKAKLAVSLNSALDETRDLLMPVNAKYPLDVLKKALLYYQKRSRFRITLEYILIPEVNMGLRDIRALRKFCGDLACKVNFIPYNAVPGLPYRAPTEQELTVFLREAQALPQAVTLRRSKGSDVCGACGQLALNHAIKNQEVSDEPDRKHCRQALRR